MLKAFGLLDMLSGISLLFLYFGFFKTIGVIFAIYLFIKGLLFFKNVISMLDMVCALFIILAVYGYWYFIDWIIIVWMLQKGIFSFL